MTARALFQPVLDRYLAAYLAHDSAACAAEYTRDGQIFSPYGPPATGTASLRAAHESWFEEGEFNKSMTILEARAEGDVGFCSLLYAADITMPDGTISRVFGSGINTFVRLPDGTWKIRHTSLNELEDDPTKPAPSPAISRR